MVTVSSPITRLRKHAWGLGLEKEDRLVKIENGGLSLRFSLCRILFTNTTKKVMIRSASSIEFHRFNRVEIPSTQIFNLYNWIKDRMHKSSRCLCQFFSPHHKCTWSIVMAASKLIVYGWN